jgi:hypothetical protein
MKTVARSTAIGLATCEDLANRGFARTVARALSTGLRSATGRLQASTRLCRLSCPRPWSRCPQVGKSAKSQHKKHSLDSE